MTGLGSINFDNLVTMLSRWDVYLNYYPFIFFSTSGTINPSSKPTSSISSPTLQLSPSIHPSSYPSHQPSRQPSQKSFSQPSLQPSSQPVNCLRIQPSLQPSLGPSLQLSPSIQPSSYPSHQPSRQPLQKFFSQPSLLPSSQPIKLLRIQPSLQPSLGPSDQPSGLQSSSNLSSKPINSPTLQPSIKTVQPLTVFTRLPTSVAPTTALPSTQRPTTASPSVLVQYNWNADLQTYGDSSVIVSISKNGQTIGAINYENKGDPIYLSNDGGMSWSLASPSPIECYWNDIAVSGTGQYIAVLGYYYIIGDTIDHWPLYMSNNYGETWTLSNITAYDPYSFPTVISDSGQYVYLITDITISKSYDFGIRWETLNLPFDYPAYLAASGSGQYLYTFDNFYDYNLTLYSSSDYGSTWENTHLFVMDNYLFQIATSFSGQYVAVLSSSTDYLSCSVFVSFNYGKSWAITSEFPLFSHQNRDVLFLSMSSSGQYLATNADSSGVYFSTDYGASWQLSETEHYYSISMNGDGTVIAAGTQSGGFVYLGKSSLTSSTTTAISNTTTTTTTTGNGKRNLRVK